MLCANFKALTSTTTKIEELVPGGVHNKVTVFKLGVIIQPKKLIVLCEFQGSDINCGRNIKGAHFYKDGPLGPLLIKLQLSNSG